tara:strand:+ start:443 stop:649 length:207 start_codon:yes stop_codon:yes gene_type:complete
MKKLITKLGLFFTSDKGGKVVEKGIELTAKNLMYKKIFKIIVISIISILLLANSIDSEVFLTLLESIL